MPRRKKTPNDYRIGLGCLFAFVLFWIIIGILNALERWVTHGSKPWDSPWGLALIVLIPLIGGFLLAALLPPPKLKPLVEYPENWPEIREQVFKRDKYRCQNCGASGVRLNCHHIVPLNKGGTNQLSNLISLCEKCHAKIHPGMTEFEHYHEANSKVYDRGYEGGGTEFEEAKKGHRPFPGFFNWPGWPGARRR